MKKRIGVFLFLLLGSLASSILLHGQPAAAADNFIIKNYVVDMELGRDGEGRSTLRTVETITADFLARDENHGLERVFVKSYEGHTTSHKLESVTDESGNKLPYHWEGDTLRIGDKDTYVNGLQTYKIAFTERDVTRFYVDTNKDEFYWDVIGDAWRVPIEQVDVRLTVAPEIRSAIKTELQCYFGFTYSTKKCLVDGEDGVYSTTVRNVGQRAGVTLALGFAPETFAGYQPSVLEQLFAIWIKIQAIVAFLSIGIIIWLSVSAYRWTYRDNEIGTIVPEYLPPKNASVAVSASVSPGYHATLAAELTDLAVRHYIQILETREKSFWRSAEYAIKVVKDTSDLRNEEKEILSDMFGHAPKIGDRLELDRLRNNTAISMKFSDNDKKITELLKTTYGFKERNEARRAWFGKVAKLILIGAILTLSPFLLVAWVVVFALGKSFWALSDEGLALRRYLKGLDLYIKVAEKDRLKMLQSPEGAEKVAVDDPTDPAQLVKLYEKVLPYAVLFGQEKEWSKRLGDYYQNTGTSPDWYSGNTAFNAVVFSSAMSSFSSSVGSTSASSSSTGGSGGGGSVGGGGGGGGGGGW